MMMMRVVVSMTVPPRCVARLSARVDLSNVQVAIEFHCTYLVIPMRLFIETNHMIL
jgi:hypothetical protein